MNLMAEKLMSDVENLEILPTNGTMQIGSKHICP